MKKTMIALALVAVMIIGVTYAFAQGPGFGLGRRGAYGQECWGYGKGSPLTPDQNTKFQELRQKFNEETAQLRGAIITKRLELQSLWTNPKTDSKTIQDKERELRDLQNQMKDKVVQYKLEARNILTPEQLTEFGSGWGMGRDFGRGHIRGHSYGMGPGYRPCN